jgi:hypothetical protein
MSLMDTLRKPSVGAPVAAVALLAAVVITVLSLSGGDTAKLSFTSVFYYDVQAKNLFPGPPGQSPPIDAPSGGKTKDGVPAGATAGVFSCSGCTEKEWFIGWVETRTKPSDYAYKDAQEMKEARIVMDPQDGNWVIANSPEGLAIKGLKNHPCPGGKEPVQCYPTE